MPDEEKWYPGKHIKEGFRRVSTSARKDDAADAAAKPEEAAATATATATATVTATATATATANPRDMQPERQDQESGPWYPGKHIKKGVKRLKRVAEARRAGKADGTWEKAPPFALRNRLRSKRELATRRGSGEPVGQLLVGVLGGSFSTSRPYVIIELDGNEARTSTGMSKAPTWEDATFLLPVHDPSADLRIFVFDDASLDNQVCIGRVIVPLASLCESVALRPTPRLFAPTTARTAVFRVTPASAQHGKAILARYNEATPGVPGTGMVRPKQDLGVIELSLELQLDAHLAPQLGLLACYAQAPPPGALEEEEGGVLEGDEAQAADADTRKLDPKTIKLYVARLKRSLGKPYIMLAPWCWSLPLVWAYVCLASAAWQLPWIVLALLVANGAIDNARRAERTNDLIYWEEEVGPNKMPRGLAKMRLLLSVLGKVQHGLGTAVAALEKRRNLLNWQDGVVTTAAIGILAVVCSLLSLLLFLVPACVVTFAVGVVPLLANCVASMQRAPAPDAAATAPPAAPPTEAPKRARQGSGAAQLLTNVLARTPDGGDIAHLHFCKQQLLEEHILPPAPESDSGRGGEKALL